MLLPLRALALAFAAPLLTHVSFAGSILAEPASPASEGYVTELIDPAALGFGPPAFVLDVTYQDTLDYDARRGGVETIETRAAAPFATWRIGEVRFGTTLDYSWRHADFGPGFGLGEKDLHTVKLRLSAFWRPENSKWWALGFVTPGIATDFSSVTSDALTLSGLALVGYQWTKTLGFAVGAYASTGVGDTNVFGAIGFIWTPNDRWIVQATPPIVAIGYRPTPDWTLGAVVHPAGDAWEVEETDSNVRQVDLSLWRAALSVERKFGPHWRVNVRGGIAFGGELELRDREERVISDTDLDPAPFGALAVKWVF